MRACQNDIQARHQEQLRQHLHAQLADGGHGHRLVHIATFLDIQRQLNKSDHGRDRGHDSWPQANAERGIAKAYIIIYQS